mgnify:FL=1
MSILIAIEPVNGAINKGGFELATFARLTADKMGSTVIALVMGSASNAGELGKYGAQKVYTLQHEHLSVFDSQVYSTVIANAAQQMGSHTVIIRNNANGKAILGRLAVKMKADAVSGVNRIPEVADGLSVSRSVYSGKAIAHYTLASENKVMSLMGNSLQPQELGSEVIPEAMTMDVPAPKISLVSREMETVHVPLPEAEKVVAAGRGMKGPEN